MAEIYKNSDDQDIMTLHVGYINIGEGIRSLSELVKEQLGKYDYQIVESYAVLMDALVPNGGGGDSPPPVWCDPAIGDCFFACTLFIDFGCYVWSVVTCALIGLITGGWGGLVCAILFGLLCLYPPMTYEECINMCINVYCY